MTNNLPVRIVTIQCSHCNTECSFDDGVWWCESCKVMWHSSDPFNEDCEPEFLDDELAPCAYPPDEPRRIDPDFTGGSRVHRGFVEHRTPCVLPTGHDSPHLFPEHYIFGVVA